jgi:hypothetical protein
VDVLAVDVGGSHVKVLASNEQERRRFVSGPNLTPQEMVGGVLAITNGWSWEVVSVGRADELDELPPNARRGDNSTAFVGGFRLWEPDSPISGTPADHAP